MLMGSGDFLRPLPASFGGRRDGESPEQFTLPRPRLSLSRAPDRPPSSRARAPPASASTASRVLSSNPAGRSRSSYAAWAIRDLLPLPQSEAATGGPCIPFFPVVRVHLLR